MPRRVYTYVPEVAWANKSLLATIGAGVLGLAVLVFLVNVVISLRRGAAAGTDPWSSDTLEWATASPPPPYNFLLLPTVRGRYALWSNGPDAGVIDGLPTDKREVLVTRTVDAELDHRMVLAGPTVCPFFVALGTALTFIGLIFTPWAMPIGLVLTAAPLVAWFWPRPPHAELLDEQP
jgi:cytochrome c oxidase subunit 1